MNKEDILINYGKIEFEEFLVQDNTGEILKLLDEEGCKMLKESGIFEDRVLYILAFSRYRNEIFKNEMFLNMFLSSDISDYYASLRHLNDETYDLILSHCYEDVKNRHKFPKLLSYFNDYYIGKSVKNWKYPIEYLYEIIKASNNPEVINSILNTPGFSLSSDKLDISLLIQVIKRNNTQAYKAKVFDGKDATEINIPPHLINKDFYERVWNSNDIFSLRTLVNNCDYCFDTTGLNNYICGREEEIISSYKEGELLGVYKDIYESLEARIRISEVEDLWVTDEKTYYEVIKTDEYKRLEEQSRKVNRIMNNLPNYMADEMRPFYEKKDKEGLFNYLKKKSDNMISNYIIDYHFKENYHNVIIDIKELLNFYYSGNISLPMEKVSLYDRILNIDYLSLEEKIALHNEMKGMNMMEMFYDDMQYSRHIVGELLKESSLSRESIKEYRDEELSSKYGVDVYKIDDNPFFAIVKTGRKLTNDLPVGHSFSVVGGGGIGVFGDVKNADTFVYDASELNPDQVIHMFPFDSFTIYKPFEYDEKASQRVNMLMTPEELMYQTRKYSRTSYNELLLLERGKQETDLDVSVPLLHQIALYCIDEIREEDIQRARAAGVGIFLVDSKKFDKGVDAPKSIYRHDVNHWNQNYYSLLDEKELEAKR